MTKLLCVVFESLSLVDKIKAKLVADARAAHEFIPFKRGVNHGAKAHKKKNGLLMVIVSGTDDK